MGSVRGYQEQKGGKSVKNCTHCKGLVVIDKYIVDCTWYQDYRCVQCARRWPLVRPVTVKILAEDRRPKRYKPFKRLTDADLSQAKVLLDAGQCVSKAARAVGIHQASLYKIARRNGWQVAHGKSGPERGKG